MVRSQARPLDATFAALADPTRRAMLDRLARGPASVGELAGPFRISLPAVSKHVRVLERAGLLRRTRVGRVHRCALAVEPIRVASLWMARYRRFWDEQLDALHEYLSRERLEEEEGWPLDRSTPLRRSRSAARFRRPGRGSSAPGRTLRS
jgi:DNA-binding transcriptional ArsR family regulator